MKGLSGLDLVRELLRVRLDIPVVMFPVTCDRAISKAPDISA
jgi:hypothetical protein